MGDRGLNHALEALLYRRSDRDAFLAGDIARFGLSPEDADALGTIDKEQLVSAAKITRTHVLQRSHRGVGNLVQAFRETVGAWEAKHPGQDLDDLASDFVGSCHFDAYRTIGFAGTGISLEEAFYHYAEDASLGSTAVRLRECATAILRSLVKTPDPVFRLPAFVLRAPKGFFVIDANGPTLLAMLGGKFVEGPITPYIVAVLTSTRLPESLVLPSDVERRAVEDELARLGLIATSPRP